MNKGNKRRRSSFGRRVSFSTATKVKEFATGDKDYTLWNSTYEEERKNVSSDSSHKSDTDSEVFLAEKTFMMNDEMEMTDVLPTVQPVDPGSATRTDMTVVGSEEMEVTMAANKTMEKFSVEDTNDQVTMEITALVKPASFFAKQPPCNSTGDDMEMTSAMTTAMLQNISDNRSRNTAVKPQSVSSVTSFLSQLKSSSASTNFEDDMEMTKPISMKETQEISIASEQRPRSSEQNDDDMEITEFLTLPTKSAKNDDMEMTKPVCFKIDTNQFKNEIISDEKVEKKELKCAKTTQTPPKSKVELGNDMEITKPISMKEIQEINIPSKQTIAMCAENNENDMEITGFLPREMLPEKTKKDCAENDDMEMTKPVCFQIESKGIANQFKEDTIAEEKEEKEKQMEDSPSMPEALTQLSEETEQVSNSRRIAQNFLEVNESKDNASEISSVNVLDINNVTTTPVNNETTERKCLEEKLTTQNDEDVEVLEPQNVKIQDKGVKTVRDEERLNETNTETSLDQSETFDEMENSSSSFLGKTSSTKVNHEMSFDLKEAENRFNEEQKAWDVKMTNLRSHIDNMKRFLVDSRGGSEEAENHEEPPPKRSKLMPSIFETLIPTKDRSHHGHWKIEHFDEKEAKFSFFQGTLELTLVLGHPSTKKDIKHWAVRRPSIRFMTMPMHNSIKLMQHLFLKEWTNERLAKVFESTVNICKSLELFGQSVNEAVRFVLNLDQIKGSHCLFKIEEFQVYVEHFSRPLHLAFAITVDFSQGFRVAKDQGTKLQPLVSRGHMISDKTFGNICKNSPSGWNYITYLSTMLDKYIKEMEKDKK